MSRDFHPNSAPISQAEFDKRMAATQAETNRLFQGGYQPTKAFLRTMERRKEIAALRGEDAV